MKNSPESSKTRLKSSAPLFAKFRQTLKDSVLLADVKDGNQTRRGLRVINDREIDQLIVQGNHCADWSRVRVPADFNPAPIQHNTFAGDIVLGAFSMPRHALYPSFPAGVFNSVLVDAVLEDETLVLNVQLLERMFLRAGSAVLHCTVLTHAGEHAFSIGSSTAIIINEGGGHHFQGFPEIDPHLAGELARPVKNPGLDEAYGKLFAQYQKRATSTRGIIGEGALVIGCRRFENSYIGPHARVEHASALCRVVALSDMESPARIGQDVQLEECILQWGSRADSAAYGRRVFLAEASEISKKAIVENAYIGPNSVVSEGEVTCSFVGPFVVSHHQSLLISAYWPGGRGNIGYGANIGSNHTGRAPDQECHIGEGLFFGLTSAVKYPANFMGCPYSIISTSVTTLSQGCGMPFSLINLPGQSSLELSPAYNEIMPGWMITDSFYSLLRAESKFAKRDRTRHHKLDSDFYTPELMDRVIQARNQLLKLQGKAVYTDADLPALGKNYMTENRRLRALLGYRDLVQFYCLKNFHAFWLTLGKAPWPEVDELLKRKIDGFHWRHVRKIFRREVGQGDLLTCMVKYLALRIKFHLCLMSNKLKDDGRAFKVFGDQHVLPLPAERDPLILQDAQDIAELKFKVKRLRALSAS